MKNIAPVRSLYTNPLKVAKPLATTPNQQRTPYLKAILSAKSTLGQTEKNGSHITQDLKAALRYIHQSAALKK